MARIQLHDVCMQRFVWIHCCAYKYLSYCNCAKGIKLRCSFFYNCLISISVKVKGVFQCDGGGDAAQSIRLNSTWCGCEKLAGACRVHVFTPVVAECFSSPQNTTNMSLSSAAFSAATSI